MCGKVSANNTDAESAMHQPVPPAALAVALVMIAIGIVIILVYGMEQKKAWKAERTYVLDEHPPTSDPNQETAYMEPIELNDDDNEPVTGLDDGLSTTLKTALITEPEIKERRFK